jgi:hypothetical protein
MVVSRSRFSTAAACSNSLHLLQHPLSHRCTPRGADLPCTQNRQTCMGEFLQSATSGSSGVPALRLLCAANQLAVQGSIPQLLCCPASLPTDTVPPTCRFFASHVFLYEQSRPDTAWPADICVNMYCTERTFTGEG